MLAFEPVPANAAAIRENVAMNGIDWVEVRETAVAGSTGRANLIISDVSAFSRLASVNVPTGARESIEVAVSSIDELLADGARAGAGRRQDRRRGGELEVIEGMRRTLAEHHPVLLCEVHDL